MRSLPKWTHSRLRYLMGELGARALRTREERSRVLKAKVEHYEQMLGEGLDKLKSVCDIATKSAAHAVLAQL